MEIREQNIEIATEDGRKLSGLLLAPESPRLTVLLSPGVAIRKERYLRFAREGAVRGAAVLLYDYRAQGGSIGPELRDDPSTITDWGRHDMPAAIAHLDRLHPELEMAAIGHSAGAWIVGLAHNHARISRHAFLCAGWAYWRLKPLEFRALELFFWYVYGPACLRLFGKVPKGGPWQGEPLSPALFHAWKAWCHSPTCDPALLAGGAGQPEHYREVKAPIRGFAYSDDPIANPRTVPLFMAVYPSAQQQTIWATPEEFGLAKIGHEGLFSRRSAKAWAPVWDYIAP